MTLTKTLSILFVASALAVISSSGCGNKKEEPAVSGPVAMAGSAKPAEPAAPAATTPPAAPPAAPAADGATFASDEDYVAKATAAMDEMIEIFKANSANCDKLAEEVTKFGERNKKMMTAAQQYEQTHPDAKKRFNESAAAKASAFEAASAPAMTACKDSKPLQEAMMKLVP